MPNSVKSVHAKGVHGRFDIQQTFHPGVNILYGRNGMGKTTLLHILANVLNGDYRRFAYLGFDSVEVLVDDDSTITIERYKESDDHTLTVQTGDFYSVIGQVKEIQREDALSALHDEPLDRSVPQTDFTDALLPSAYFPAFRTMIEAWGSVDEVRQFSYPGDRSLPGARRTSDSDQWVQLTAFARRLFGQFVPQLSFPSPREIEQRLTEEIQAAMLNLARVDRNLLSQAFLDIFSSLSSSDVVKTTGTPEDILKEIKHLSDSFEEAPLKVETATEAGMYFNLRQQVHSFQVQPHSEQVAVPVLRVYRESLKRRMDEQQKSFASIKLYLESVNEFLEGKRLESRAQLEVSGQFLKSSRSMVELDFGDGSSATGLRALSSGERQIVTLIYAATHMSAQKVVLIDEPEISLHIDWQRRLLKKMAEQMGGRQIIACTHSPIVGADYEDRMVELQLSSTNRSAEVDSSA